MIELALERLVDGVAAVFTRDAGKRSILETANFSGSASLSGTPDDFAEPRLSFDNDGTIGVDGLLVRLSLDDGEHYSPQIPLGTSTTLEVAGVTLTMSGAVAEGDYLRWQQTSPIVPTQVFGSREPAKRGDIYRLCWVPGDDSNAGKFDRAIKPGRNPRPLMTFDELVTVYVEGADVSNAESERSQYRATRLLLNATLRAIYVTAHGTYTIESAKVLNDRSTRRHGFAYRLVLSLQSPIPDRAFTTLAANAHASVTTSVYDVEDGPDLIEPSGDSE